MLKTIATLTLMALIILLAKMDELVAGLSDVYRAPLNNYCLLISLVRLSCRLLEETIHILASNLMNCNHQAGFYSHGQKYM